MPRKTKKQKAHERKMKEREKQFDMRFSLEKLPKYNGLYDRNLRHHFENRRIQPVVRPSDFAAAANSPLNVPSGGGAYVTPKLKAGGADLARETNDDAATDL